MNQLIRIGVMNNYNFTEPEIRAVQTLQSQGKRTFVNSNSHVKIRQDAGPAVITINPDLDKFVEPKGELQNVKAVRIKYVANPTPTVARAWADSISWAQQNQIPILVTIQRFVRKETMTRYSQDHTPYTFKKGYMRLDTLPPELDGMNVCDRSGQGCPSCQLCATLTTGQEAEIQGLNLEESGNCMFKCPDCFAKKCLMGNQPAFGKIKKNKKMEGYI